MADCDSMPVLLFKMKAAELQAESSRKELNSTNQEIAKQKYDIQTLGQRLSEAKTYNSNSYDQLHETKFEWEYLGSKEIMLLQMLPETLQTLENEKVALEDIQFKVWQERQDFCDNVLEFSNKYGLLATPKPPPVQVKVEEPVEDPELSAAEAEVTEMEVTYQNLELQLIACETEVDVAKQEICLLNNETSKGQDFLRLQDALKFSQEQSKVVEAECKSIQQLLSINDRHPTGSSKSQTRPQSLSFNSVTQQSKRPGGQSKHSSFRQVQHHSDYEDDQSDENFTLEDAPRLRGHNNSGRSNRHRSSWGGGDEAAMSAEEYPQIRATTESAGDIADRRQHRSPQSYDGQSSSSVHLTPNQGKKRTSFIPKTPSAISKKLMLKKDRCLLLEKDFCAMLVSPTKPGARASNKVPSATHGNKTSTSLVQQGQSNSVKPSSAQHRKPIKMEPDPNRPTESSRRAFKPYIT